MALDIRPLHALLAAEVFGVDLSDPPTGDLAAQLDAAMDHRARRFDDRTFKRDLRRLTLQDSAPTLEQAA